MTLHEKIKEHSGLSTAIACAAIVLAAMLILRQLPSSAASRYIQPKWMYNLNTKTLVVGGAHMQAPYNDGSELFDYGKLGEAGALVDAVIYTCGDPTAIKEGMTAEDLASADVTLVYLTRGTENSPGSTGGLRDIDVGFVASIDGQEWIRPMSTEGTKIQDMDLCGDGKLPRKTRP